MTLTNGVTPNKRVVGTPPAGILGYAWLAQSTWRKIWEGDRLSEVASGVFELLLQIPFPRVVGIRTNPPRPSSNPRVDAFGSLIDGDKMLMTVDYRSGLLKVPGGNVNPKEKTTVGVAREFYEETGIAWPDESVGVYFYNQVQFYHLRFFLVFFLGLTEFTFA